MRATLCAEFEHSLRRHADKTAIEAGSRRLSYRDLDRWSHAVANQLVHQGGVQQGDVVAVYTANCPEFLVIDVAIARIGAVKLPVNAKLPASTIAYILGSAKAVALLSGTSVAATADQALADLASIYRIEVNDGADEARRGLPELIANSGDLETPPLPHLTISESSAAALYFTGGTTGKPKGVLHSQASTVAFHYVQMLEAEIEPDDRLLLMTPLAHAAGLFAQSALIRGATCVLTEGFDAVKTVSLLSEAAITWTFLVPTMIYRVLDILADTADFAPSVRTIIYGAAPISPRRLEDALQTFGRVFVQLYGQTESPNWGTRLAKADHDLARPELLASCGTASIATDVAVIDDDGNVLAAGEVGEIWLRSPYMLTEYIGDVEATNAKFVNGGIRTGDIGVLDDAGYLYLRDRKSDMVVTGGMNVYCREVEDVLGAHPSVASVAVIGVPHDDWGESVHAVVIPADDNFSAEAILKWARPRLASYARPKSFEVVTNLPETPLGKIDKAALRAPHWSSRDRGIG